VKQITRFARRRFWIEASSALALGLIFVFFLREDDVREPKEVPLFGGHFPSKSAAKLFLKVLNGRKRSARPAGSALFWHSMDDANSRDSGC
jgi:hypothetical protein